MLLQPYLLSTVSGENNAVIQEFLFGFETSVTLTVCMWCLAKMKKPANRESGCLMLKLQNFSTYCINANFKTSDISH